MYKAINGTYEDGNIILEEAAPTTQKTKVVVMFMEDSKKSISQKQSKKGIILGELKGKVGIPEDFNEPLDDLKEYMYQ